MNLLCMICIFGNPCRACKTHQSLFFIFFFWNIIHKCFCLLDNIEVQSYACQAKLIAILNATDFLVSTDFVSEKTIMQNRNTLNSTDCGFTKHTDFRTTFLSCVTRQQKSPFSQKICH